MKYLIIGDANSMHIYNYVKNVLLPNGYSVYLMTLSVQPIRKEYMDFYRLNNVKVFSVAYQGYKDLDKNDIYHRVKNLLRKYRLAKSIPDCDICHIHSVYKTSLRIYLKNRKKFKKVILSYWGGDIEDKNEKVIRLREKCFEYADAITVTVQQTYDEFIKIYGHSYDKKISVCRFATEGLECILKLSKGSTREKCREFYDIGSDQICVTCGYSAYAAQHQDLCLNLLNKLPSETKKKLHVIVPMQYGRFDASYIESVQKAAESCDFKCTILDKFLPFEDSVKLPIATDIYIHVRDTDAFSNALKEHVFAKSKVVIGSWLKYPELEQMGADIDYIDFFDELTNKVYTLIQTTKRQKEVELFMPIYEMYSAQKIKEQWLQVINGIK